MVQYLIGQWIKAINGCACRQWICTVPLYFVSVVQPLPGWVVPLISYQCAESPDKVALRPGPLLSFSVSSSSDWLPRILDPNERISFGWVLPALSQGGYRRDCDWGGGASVRYLEAAVATRNPVQSLREAYSFHILTIIIVAFFINFSFILYHIRPTISQPRIQNVYHGSSLSPPRVTRRKDPRDG